MQRFFLEIAYNGSNFHGWQVQPNGNSIQAELNNALSTLLRQPTDVVGAGRTDAGVHAKKMVAHFDGKIDNLKIFQKSLNGLLPHSIVVNNIRKVLPNAHARFSAIARSYEYHVYMHKNPFLEQFAQRIPENTDFEAMNRAAKWLLSYSDFTSFSKLHTDNKTNICSVTFAQWKYDNNEWIFEIEANRFLRNMVRAIVGTLLCVGKGAISETEFCKIIEQKDRCAAAASAPAKGLFLTNVTYPEELFSIEQ